MDALRNQRKERQTDRVITKAKQQARREKLKEAYEHEYEKSAIKAVKTRARREAFERHSKKQSVIGDIGKGLEQLGNWATGNQSVKRSSGKRRGKKGKPRKTQSSGFDVDIFPDDDFGEIGSLF